jgi:hypothetical protein
VDYFDPNEGEPEKIGLHLKRTKKGLSVVTGTERGFFHILFSEDEHFVFRDINHRVKLYVDCNLLLIRFSETMSEYAELSRPLGSEAEFFDRCQWIEKKLLMSDLKENPKNYYLKNLPALLSIYLKAPKCWRNESSIESSCYFDKCNYCNNEAQFLKIQKIAKSGNIISTIGDINELTFLKSREVTTVDVSNITDYCMLNLQVTPLCRPRVIWTTLSLGPIFSVGPTIYRSYIHYPMEKGHKEEIDECLRGIERDFCVVTIPAKISWLQKHIARSEDSPFESSAGPIYSIETLHRLKSFTPAPSASWDPFNSSGFF